MPHFEFLENDGLVIASAHRGGIAEAARLGLDENSIAAFDNVINKLGYGYVETDVRGDEQGTAWVWHGQGAERMNKRGPLKRADVLKIRHNGERAVPTIQEVLEEFPDTKFSIDPKNWPATEALGEAIVACNAINRVCVGAFSQKRTIAVAQTVFEESGRQVCTSMGPGNLKTVAWRAYTKPDAEWEAPDPGLAIPRTASVDRVIRAAHAGGAKVITWVVNEHEEMLQFLNRGVDGIMTDEPSLLKATLANRGQWREAA